FHWLDATDSYSWVRLTTNAGAERPNPTVDLRGKVRFTINNLGDFASGSVGLCVAVRETGVQASLMANGGTAGAIELVGASTSLSVIEPGVNELIDSTPAGDDVAWVDGGVTKAISWGPDRILQTVPAGDDVAKAGYIRAEDNGDFTPVPAVTVPISDFTFKTVEVDLATGQISYDGGAPVGSVAAFTGDGVLSTPNNKGVLEALIITNDASDLGTSISLYIDELQFESPDADPTPVPSIQAPVISSNTQVKVDCLQGAIPAQDATLAELFINDVSQGTAAPSSYVATFSGLTLVVGDVLTARQQANGLWSDLSSAVVVYGPGTALADNFDSYADQAGLEGVWQQTDPASVRKFLLSTGSASSCDNMLMSYYGTVATAESRLYYDMGTVDGTDAEPLLVTYRFKHDINLTSARTRFELASSLTRTYGALGFGFTNGLTGLFNTQYTTITNSPNPVLTGYSSDYFSYDYARTGVDRVPGVWHKMQIEVKTDTVNFYIDDQLVNTPYDANNQPMMETNGITPLYADGVPRINPTTPFRYIILGNGYTNNGIREMYDDISVTLGGTPVPFGPPVAVTSPSVVAPLFPAATTVNLADVDPTATLVAVYANDNASPLATAAGPFPEGTASVTVTPLVDGDVIGAVQTVGGVESCLSATVIVGVSAPTVESVLVPSQTQVSVSNIEEGLATDVTVYRKTGEESYELLGALSNPAADPAVVTTTALTNEDLVVATQTIGGVEGPYSAGVTVAVPTPTLVVPLEVGQTAVTVDDLHPLASTANVYVNAASYGAATGGAASVPVTVPALMAGDVIKASQTIGGVEGPQTAAYVVANYLVVNEFQYDDTSTDDYQFVELYNAGPSSMDISGYIIELGDTVARYTVTIPAGSTITSGGFWTVGQSAVASMPGAVVDLVDNSLNVGDSGYLEANGEIYVAVRNPANTLLDAAAVETNKGRTLPADVQLQIGPGIWGNTVMSDGASGADLASDGRFFDGVDTDNNGRDFGIIPATPGYSNVMPDRMPYYEDFNSVGIGLNVPNWYWTYVPARVCDPTVADTINPAAIPASPDGGNVMVAWDETGGGNADFLSQMAKEDFSLETYIYIPPVFTPNGYEETKIGIRGTSDGLHNFDWYNGSTGLAWLWQRTTTSQGLWLIDENDGDDGSPSTPISATILGSINIGTDVALTGWQRLLLETQGNKVRGIFGGTYGSRADGIQFVATHASPGPGGVWLTYREAMSSTGIPDNRPPTLDAFSLKAPPAVGDIDADGDVDLADYTRFAACLNGPDVTTPPAGCSVLEFDAADIDVDGDVDLADFADFQVVY
ncbi:MAG: lamin tail domain-containing protein, partial [Phycisphaerae bacterium]|nr:lamin tail domain-containing protein [Phycisphaerae bacterium]